MNPIIDSGHSFASGGGVERLISLQRMRPVMGTLCTVAATGSLHPTETAIEAAFAELQRVEKLMHPTRFGSDLQRLRAQPGESLQIDASTVEVLGIAARLYQQTDGVFDPCLPECEGHFGDIELCGGKVAIAHREVAVDLGGIAKGYAVDRAIDVLRAAGCVEGMVNAGGDLRVFGPSAVPITVRLTDSVLAPLELQDRALAVSDARAAAKPAEFRGYYSRCATAAIVRNQAVVVARTAVVADALTKCALLCDEMRLAPLMRSLDADLVRVIGVPAQK